MTAPPDITEGQPYQYVRQQLVEPDWRRFPGWRQATEEQWRDPTWQRSNSVRSVRQLKKVTGDLLTDTFCEDLVADQAKAATMSLSLPPQMFNTIAVEAGSDPTEVTEAFYADPVRRYMLPLLSDRDPFWPSHPHSIRDPLHEADMWAVEGLTHRYPTKVLAELVATCPQYCGHCTRMDLVGASTPQVTKLHMASRPSDRQEQILEYLRRTPGVRDVVVSGGDLANVPWPRLEEFLSGLLAIDSIRDIRLATKALIGLPQHWLQSDVLEGVERVARRARSGGVNLAVHTHANHAQSVTPLVAEATWALLDAGVRDVRNQGVLMHGVNDSAESLLDLCFALHGEAGIVPYYFYMCDMIPNAEHWRIPVWKAQNLQRAIMGYLPGYATPRVVCDVPFAGKQWVHQLKAYDRITGISTWEKDYRTLLETDDPHALRREYHYYDPVSTLPLQGRRWWADQDTDRSQEGATC